MKVETMIRLVQRPWSLVFAVALAAVLLLFPLEGVRAADDRALQQQALTPLQWLVGQWKGAGQVRRGSTQGAWAEEAEWAWKFDDRAASLALTVTGGKHLQSARLNSTGKDAFTLSITGEDKKQRNYACKVTDDGSLVFLGEGAASAPLPDRITLRQAAGGDRLVMVLERSSGGADRFLQIAEIGYTRKGSGFGQGGSGPECVVTGGRGTIEVKHEGKTYYVCCTGCRDLFNADPAGVLKEYRERKAKEQAQPKK